jgi:hypothetical protein
MEAKYYEGHGPDGPSLVDVSQSTSWAGGYRAFRGTWAGAQQGGSARSKLGTYELYRVSHREPAR